MKVTTGRLEIEVISDGHEHRITMQGQIDERADLSTFAAGLQGRLIIDLAKLSFINSIGVREWLRMLRRLKEQRSTVILRRCSEAMTHQMNMILDVATGALVESFHAPYMCDGCGYEASMCLEIARHPGLREQVVPKLPCPECKATMEFNELPARYLYFLSVARTEQP